MVYFKQPRLQIGVDKHIESKDFETLRINTLGFMLCYFKRNELSFVGDVQVVSQTRLDSQQSFNNELLNLNLQSLTLFLSEILPNMSKNGCKSTFMTLIAVL
jgi:hypothetical protein